MIEVRMIGQFQYKAASPLTNNHKKHTMLVNDIGESSVDQDRIEKQI